MQNKMVFLSTATWLNVEETATRLVVRPTITAEPSGTVGDIEIRVIPISKNKSSMNVSTESRQAYRFNTSYSIFNQITNLKSPFQVITPIPVVLTKVDGNFVASFNDANIHMSGDTESDAVTNLKLLIIDIFNEFSLLRPEQLGPGPAREFQILQSYVRKRPHVRQRPRN